MNRMTHPAIVAMLLASPRSIDLRAADVWPAPVSPYSGARCSGVEPGEGGVGVSVPAVWPSGASHW